MVAAKNQSNVRIFGGDDDAVWVGPKGVTFPTTAAPLVDPGATIIPVGWLGEDGVNFDQDQTINRFNGHQGGSFLRQRKSGVQRSFTFQALEETATTLGLYYPGITRAITGTTPNQVATFTVPAGARSDERAWMIDLYDGTNWKRYKIPVGEVGETGTIAHTGTGLTVYEFTVGILGGFTLETNAAGTLV